MAAALSDAQIAQIEQQLSQHPEIVQAIQADAKKLGGRFQYTHAGDPRARQGPADVLAKYGINFPDAVDYQIQIDPKGNVGLKRSNWFQRNSDWVLPVATIGTLGAASALSAGAPAVSAATTPAATPAGAFGPMAGGYAGATTEATVPTALASVGSGAGTAVAPAAAASKSIWGKIAGSGAVPSIIEGATGLGSSLIAANASKAATKAQTDAAEKALQWEKDVFAQRQTQLEPFIGPGAASNVKQAELLGLPTPAGGYQPPPAPGTPPQPAAAPTPSQVPPASPDAGTARPVTMISPTGQTIYVPPDKVAEVQMRGAKFAQ